jgi:phosphatidylserine decarboxylase
MSFVGSRTNFSIHNDGLSWIAGCVLFTIFVSIWSVVCGIIGVFLTLFCVYFFRDPKRVVPVGDNFIISPADGIISSICLETPNADFEIGLEPRYKISIFLSILDVHVNRVPARGLVKKVLYRPGEFINATLDKASIFNERNTVVMSLSHDDSKLIAFSQIAGMLARRIICDLHEGQEVSQGAAFGLIRFGSRCDVWLPADAVPQVIKGQRVVAGETVLCDLFSDDYDLRRGVEI